MKKIFKETTSIEKKVRENLSIPDFLMMENAALSLKELLLSLKTDASTEVVFLCGKGNNGGDGLAVARLLQQYMTVLVYCPTEPTSSEAKREYFIAKQLEIKFVQNDFLYNQSNNSKLIFVDCIFGTGFHGNLPPDTARLIKHINSIHSIKISCDIPSGIDESGNVSLFENKEIAFNADYTVTMGSLKLALFSDSAKNFIGKIIVANLGISQDYFEKHEETNFFLIEKQDLILPLRKSKTVNKGSFGYTTVVSGEKTGASIISSTAALHFGTGIVSLLPTESSNINQFKVSPELIISSEIPKKTTCVVIGCGLGNLACNNSTSEKILNTFLSWFLTTKNPSCVIDADLFYYFDIKNLFTKLSSVSEARIILTPHPKELLSLCELCGIPTYDGTFSSIIEHRIDIASEFHKLFPNITLILKGSNTFISCNNNIYICNLGNQNLAKAGSGDVLTGLVGSLLAQGYNSKEAAISAVLAHSLASCMETPESYSLTPEKLIENISNLHNFNMN